MVQLNNQNVTKELQKQIKDVSGTTPNQVSNSIVPVIVGNPKPNGRVIVQDGTKTSSGTTTIYTTPNNEREIFYLTSVMFTVSADDACDGTEFRIKYQPKDGEGVNVRIGKAATDEGINQTVFMPYSDPIPLRKNSTVQLITSYTVGAAIANGVITGYVDDG